MMKRVFTLLGFMLTLAACTNGAPRYPLNWGGSWEGYSGAVILVDNTTATFRLFSEFEKCAGELRRYDNRGAGKIECNPRAFYHLNYPHKGGLSFFVTPNGIEGSGTMAGDYPFTFTSPVWATE